MALMGVREYARHRGVSHVTVINAIKGRRLVASVSKNDKGQPVIDSDKADKEWGAGPQEIARSEGKGNPRPIPEDDDEEEESSPSNNVDLYNKARAQKENYKAKQAKLDYLEQSRKLVPADKVKSEWVAIASILRTKILGIPTKLKQKTPDLSVEQYTALESIVREALEELADGD